MSNLFSPAYTHSERSTRSTTHPWLSQFKWLLFFLIYVGFFLVFPGMLISFELLSNNQLYPAKCYVKDVLGAHKYALLVVPANNNIAPFDHVFKARRGEQFENGDEKNCFFRVDLADALYTRPFDVQTVQFHSEIREPNKASVAILSVFIALAAGVPIMGCICCDCYKCCGLREEEVASSPCARSISCPSLEDVTSLSSLQFGQEGKEMDNLDDLEHWIDLEGFEVATVDELALEPGDSVTMEEL